MSQQSGIFNRGSIDQEALNQRAYEAGLLVAETFPFLDAEFKRRRQEEQALDEEESLQKGVRVESTKVEYIDGVTLKTSRNLPRPGEKRHANQDLVKVMEIAPGVQMTLLIDGASEVRKGEESSSEQMAARYADYIESNEFPDFKSKLPGILTKLTSIPSVAMEGSAELEVLIKNLHNSFVAYAKENAYKLGFENYDTWAGFGYMSMIFPIRRTDRRGKLTNALVAIEMGSKDHRSTQQEIEAGLKPIQKGDSGHITIINGKESKAVLHISSYFNNDALIANESGELESMGFPDGNGYENLSGYTIWYGEKPNTSNRLLHIVRPSKELLAFRTTIIEGLEDDAVTVGVSDAARMDQLEADYKLHSVNPNDDFSEVIVINKN